MWFPPQVAHAPLELRLPVQYRGVLPKELDSGKRREDSEPGTPEAMVDSIIPRFFKVVFFPGWVHEEVAGYAIIQRSGHLGAFRALIRGGGLGHALKRGIRGTFQPTEDVEALGQRSPGLKQTRLYRIILSGMVT